MDPINPTGLHRPSEQKIKDLAESHVAYGWAPSPGSHDRTIIWLPEDTKTYMRFYKAAQESSK